MAPGTIAAAAPALAVTRLTLTDFRCYAQLRLDTAAVPVVLTGPNGAGKTNLLEALSFLIPGRGLRRARLAEASRRDPGAALGDGAVRPWAVAATVTGPDGDTAVGTGLEPETDKRLVHIDGVPAGAQADLADHVSLQWLTPQMDRLFIDGPSARRRFLDRLVFGRDAAHAGRVSAYDHAMRERLRLLTRGGGDAAWLAALETTMAEKGVAIAAARLDAAGRLAAQLDAEGDGPFPQALLAVEGEAEAWLADGSALDAEDRLRAALAAARREDAGSGRTANGPHRSDLVVQFRGRGAAPARPAADCSTGEQKALLISLVLAQARLQAAEGGRAPLLLLDEVAAHLDADRRQALFDAITGLNLQAWMTGTDTDLFRPLADRAQFFHVKEATVSPQGAARQ